jgi:hypothetical protein
VTDPLVRKVDHVFVPIANPTPLFTGFTETLGLPTAWADHDYGAIRSSGVCLGNANLEFVRSAPDVMPALGATEPLTIRGIAFEAADPGAAIAELDARGIAHSPPIPSAGEDGGQPLWTNILLGEMPPAVALAFFCEYHANVSVRGEPAMEALHACNGGMLGVKGVAEIQIGVTNLDAATAAWGRLLAPAETDRYGRFLLAEGPAIRLRRSPIDGVQGLVVEVDSVGRARDALKERDLLGPMRRTGVGIDYAHTGGLDIWLAEAR